MKGVLLLFVFSLLMEGVFGETDVTLPVKEGDSVTLHTGLIKIQEDDVIDWRFGAGRDRIARINKAADKITYYDVLDGTFKDRLKLDDKTGDLTIINIRTVDYGDYEVTNTTTTNTFKKTFSVIAVSGLSPGAVTGIVVAVLVPVAAAVGFYYRYWTKKQML